MSDYVSPALERMAARAKLPIRVHCDDIGIIVAQEILPPPDSLYAISYDGDIPAEASQAYFRLVESLSSPPLASSREAPSEAGSAAITGSSPPGGR